MYKNVIDPGKSVSSVMKDIDIGGQNQYAMCTGPLFFHDDDDHDYHPQTLGPLPIISLICPES